jgi:acyl transferase domain-containing protein/acyl carrier protein
MEQTAPEFGEQIPIAVVGIGAIMPGALDAGQFWRNVLTGRDLITDVPPGHWLIEDYYDPDPGRPGKTYARRGAFLPEVEFEPLRHRVPPTDVPATDTAQLLALMVAEQVLADLARTGASAPDRERVSVVLGSSALEMVSTMACRMQYPLWLKALRENGIPESQARAICDDISAHYVPATEASFPGLLSNVVAGRIANRFDLHGSNYTTDAACASSLAAIHSALGELALNRADLVLTGGVDAANGIDMFMCFTETPALSPTGDCRPFSAGADGTLLGEGLAMFALKRLADAERDGDRVYAVLRGMGTSSDGAGTAIYAPVAPGQARALRRAYRQAGYRPECVELVEAHGTGTSAGDRAEFEALREVFDDGGRQDRQWCALGSVKSQIGHTKAAAGAAGLLKAVLALHHKVLPPTIKVDRPNPDLAVESSPFYVNTDARPWVRGPDHPRRAAVSSFGFGGSNFHLTLEEHVPGEFAHRDAWRCRAVPAELVVFGADSPADLLALIEEAGRARELGDLARESQHAFSAARPHRLALVATDSKDLRTKLAEAASLIAREEGTSFSAPGGLRYEAGPAPTGRVAFLFPGQGAQYVGMGAELAIHEPRAQAVWDAHGCLDSGDRPLHRVVFPPPAFTDEDRAAQQALLIRTEWAQPALAVHSLALLRVLEGLGLRPDCVAGHSFGELVALHCSGVFSAADLVRLARRRGEEMAAAAGIPGTMVAVGGGRDEIADALDRYGEADVWLANDNGPGQVVLSGAADAVAAVSRRLREDGHSVRPLDAATAFHSPLVAAASPPLAEFLRGLDVSSPRVTVYAGADAQTYEAEPDRIRGRVAGQLASPVRFADTIEAMYADGVRTFVEVGPNTTLCGLTRAILGDREHRVVGLDRAGRNGFVALLEGLARLAVAGVELDYDALWTPYAPSSPGEEREQGMTMKISGTNYGKPYPPAGGAAELPPPNPGPSRSARPMEPPPPVPAGGVEPVRTQPPIASAGRGVPDDAVLRVFEEAQRETAKAHEEFQRSLTESHLAFLRMSETSFGMLLGFDGNRPAGPAQRPRAEVPPVPALEPAPMPEPPPIPVVPPVQVRVPAISASWEDEPAVPVSAAPRPAAGGRTGGESLDQILLSVVADRTGYPVDMVRLDMDLVDDLGIDSIKRVEIFSAVQQRAEELVGEPLSAEVAELSKLRTLREIAECLGRQDSAAPRATSAVPVAGSGAEPPRCADRTTGMVGRFILRPAPKAVSGEAMPGLAQGPVVVVGGGEGIAGLVARGLSQRGTAASAVERVPTTAHAVVLLGLGRSPDEARTAAWEAFDAARSVASSFTTGGGVFVTVQDTGGDFGLSGRHGDRAWLGGLAGLARTVAKEWPLASVKAIDCEQGERDAQAVADAIVGELLDGGGDPDVALRADGGRFVPRWESAPIGSGDSPEGRADPVGPESVIVATGGARGVTAQALLELARTRRPRLLLLGRTALTAEPDGLSGATGQAEIVSVLAARDGGRRKPLDLAGQAQHILAVREVEATIEALRQAGAQVRYADVDIRDAAAVASALEETRAIWGPITGLVHGAGVLADSEVADKTDAEFGKVFDTKVMGLRALLAATANDPLRLLCVFSSVAGCFGNAGQSDYAMANEILDQVASAEGARRPGALVRAIAWGPWRGGMVVPPLAERFRSAGIALIPPEDGAAAFVRELRGPRRPVRVMVAASEPSGFLGPVEMRVELSSHPHLADHVIGEVPVLPVAMALDWFAAAARRRDPEPDLVVLRDLRVLRKVTLPGGRGRLFLHTVSGSDGPWLELRLPGGLTHYRARLTDAPDLTDATGWTVPPDLPPFEKPEIYDGHVLFHGPRFQSLLSVEGLADTGAAGTVAGAAKLGWQTRDWQIDPAAADGGLQLACLWGERVLGGRCLPMAIGETRVHRPGVRPEISRCLLRARKVHHSDALCDIALIGSDGTPVLEMLGVDVVLYLGED